MNNKNGAEFQLGDTLGVNGLIGGLLYVAMCTHPHVAAAVSILGRKTSCPSQADWVEAKRILRYLKGTVDHELILGADFKQLEVFVDADWAGDTKDRKLTTGYLIRYTGGMIGGCSRKQECVTLSSSEAEHVAITESCKELSGVLQLFDDLESNSSERRSKHVDTTFHYALQLKQQGIISPQYLPTNEMIADMMTKPLPRVKQSRFRVAAMILPSWRSVGG